jgi:alpha-mannosidase
MTANALRLSALSLLVASLALTALPAQAETKPAVDNVWVVFKTHFDLGYTDRIENVLKRYRTEMMDNAMRNIEADRKMPAQKRFAWTVAGWPMKHILGPQQDAERREKIMLALREGSLAVHALPGSLHTESFDLEDLVRGLGFSSQIARKCGRPLPIAAKMTDVPVHSWVMPTLLANAGVKFLQIGCNDACQYARVPPLFWWEGPDGSRVLCNYTIRYGSSFTPPADWPSKNYLAMIMTGDNAGPPTATDVEKIRGQVAQTLPGVAVHFATLDDFAKAVLAENPKLPVVRGDMPDTWIHGLLSMPVESKTARNVRPLEPAVELLDTQLQAWGVKTASLAEPLAEAYEHSFLYGEHTWGRNGTYGGNKLWGDDWKNKLPAEQQQNFLASFDDHRNYIRKTDEIIRRELASRLAILARSVKATGRRIVVFNPLPWPRSGIVAVNLDGNARQLVDSDSGQSIACDCREKVCRFLATDVPAGGYRTYFVPKISNDAPPPSESSSSSELETPRFKATFDLRRGGLASLVDKTTGRELVDRSSEYALGQFLHERFSEKEVKRFFDAYARPGEEWIAVDLAKPGMPDASRSPYAAIVPTDWRIAVRRTSVEDIATLTAGDTKGLAHGVSLVFTFPRNASWVDVEWRVAAKTPNKIPEGGWLCFPFAIEKPQFLLGRPGGPVDPTREIIPGSNRHLAAVATGVAITNAAAGVCLCPIDSPLVSLDRPGLWRYSLDFTPEKPAVFVNLYNNMWNTNFPLWIDGSWTSRVRVWPSRSRLPGGTSDERPSPQDSVQTQSLVAKDLAVRSWQARLPLLAATTDAPSGTLPATQPGIRLSRPGVLLTAFGHDPDNNPGTLLRVWDQSGVPGPLTVQLPDNFPATKAQPVTLRGEKLGPPLPILSGKFTFDLKAFAPASFILNDR